jgi:hydrogenase maturation factor
MLKLRPDGGLTSPNAMRIENDKPKTVKSTTNQPEQQEMDKIIAKYDHLFQGIGKITDKKNNREIYGQFHMKAEAEPAIVLSKIKAATAQDNTLRNLSQIIHKGNWMEYRKIQTFHLLWPSKTSYTKQKVSFTE